MGLLIALWLEHDGVLREVFIWRFFIACGVEFFVERAVSWSIGVCCTQCVVAPYYTLSLNPVLRPPLPPSIPAQTVAYRLCWLDIVVDPA